MNDPKLFAASWVLLLLLSGLVVLGSIASTANALRGGPDAITPAFDVLELERVSPDAATAVRGRRLTAATWALAYGALALYVVVNPYRRGERWAWWALLVSLGLPQLVSAARVLALDTRQGAGTAAIVVGVLLLGLLLGAPRMFARD